MPVFEIWGKAASKPEFERFCELNQIAGAATDTVRNQIAAMVASRWLEQNGDGEIEFRDAGGTVMIRLTQP